MKTFKNTSYKTRDYECTNVVYCQAESMPDGTWVECPAADLEKSTCIPLWIEAGVRYFGYL